MTGLRFPLALWIVLYHLTGPGQPTEAAARALPEPLFAIVRGGYLAVTTFFVLSGFVVAHTYAGTRWSGAKLARYGFGRFARIYPVYLVSMAAIAPFILAESVAGKARLVAVHALLLQGWFGHLPVSWNTPAWALSCEVFFYLVFPLAAPLLRDVTWRKTAITAAAACSLTRLLWAAGVPDTVKPLIHLSDFLMGIAAWCAWDLLLRAGRRISGAWLYVPGGVAGLALIARPNVLPHLIDVNTGLRPLNALLMIGLALGGGAAAGVLSTRAVVYLGKCSYAMYILHIPLLWWWLRWSHDFAAAAYIAAVLAVSAAVYSFIEEPANRGLRSRFQAALKA